MQGLINCIAILCSVSCLCAHALRSSYEIAEEGLRGVDYGFKETENSTKLNPKLMMNPGEEEIIGQLIIDETNLSPSNGSNHLVPVIRTENATGFIVPHTTTSVAVNSHPYKARIFDDSIFSEERETESVTPSSPFTLNDFRDVAANPNYLETTQLIINEQGDNDSIQDRKIPNNDSSDVKEYQNRAIMAALKAVTPLGIVDDLLQDQDRSISGLRIGPDPLTIRRLREILTRLEESTAMPEGSTTSSSFDLGIVTSSHQYKSFPADYKLITKEIKELMSKLNSKLDSEKCHAYLKVLKKNSVPINLDYSIVWNTDLQCFAVQPIDETNNNNSQLIDIVSADLKKTLDILNKYVELERQAQRARYADSCSLEDQDQSKLLDELLSPLINTNSYSIQVAHSSKEEEFSPKIVPAIETITTSTTYLESIEHTIASSSSTDNISMSNGRSILLFGFNVADQLGPRGDIQKILETNFSQIMVESMIDYNRRVGISNGLHFISYLNFIKEAKNNKLSDRVTSENLQAKPWADFLSTHILQFDFSKKLNTQEAKQCFIAKNYDNITQNNGISPELKTDFSTNNVENWNSIINKLNPALDLLANVGELIREEDSELFTKKFNSLTNDYATLVKDARINKDKAKNDQKIVLNSILGGAFFRKTSKLGLEFAQHRKIPVCFVWKLPDFSGSNRPNITTLEDLYKYFEKKPYYSFNFIKDGQLKYKEAITSSEMRHLNRLQSLGLLKMERIAPNYLLIREIIDPNKTTATLPDVNLGV